jgi:hypothetical protein
MENLLYLLYCLPVIFVLLSYKYMRRFKKLQGSGKIPYILGAKLRQNVFLCLAVISALMIIVTL